LGEQTFIKSTIIKCAACAHANIFNQPYPYHAGFSDQGFLYDDAGHLTLVWSCYDPAFKALLGSTCPWSLEPTAGRCESIFDFMKQFWMFATLAIASGGSACFR
jgi:hypothetical protein